MPRKIALLVCAVTVSAAACSSDVTPRPTRPPLVSGLIVDGSPSQLDDALRARLGKPVVVNYWATWCGPCKEEMPRIVAAAERYDGRVEFLGVNVEDDVSSAAAFARRYDMPFRSLADPDGDIRTSETILGLPVTQFYARDGDLAFLHQGEITAKELEEKIEGVLSPARGAREKD